MATFTYSVAGAQLIAGQTPSGTFYITLILPSGRKFVDISGWTRQTFDNLITDPRTSDDDAAALQAISSGFGEIVVYMRAELNKLILQVPGGTAAASDPVENDPTKVTAGSDPGVTGAADDDNVENVDPQTLNSDNDPSLTNNADDDNENVENRNPQNVDGSDSEGYGSSYADKGEEVLSEDGTPTGFYRNPETGEIYDPNGTVQSTSPDSSSTGSSRGLFGAQQDARSQASQQDQSNFNQKADWRVRLSLAPGANYLYKAPDVQGILAPLAATDGIIFPYTPNISMSYAANYDGTTPTHSNYKIYQYTSSSVEGVNITCDFTAQDTYEANYLLAVIHFFRTITKMFYGQDENPKPGTPPPLCFLYGLGAFQFSAHPLVITNFAYNLPNDVDYIRAGVTTTLSGVNKSAENSRNTESSTSSSRLGNGILPGGKLPPTTFDTVPGGTVEPTYVPTKMQIQISALPIVTRNQISNAFSLKDYATGKLLQGTKRQGGGIW